MAVSYIPQNKVFAVCTFQLSSAPQKFSYSRGKVNVYYQNKKQPVLTADDKNIMREFTCKSPWNLAGTLLAFGAGLLLVASGPVGWIAVGLIVAGTVAVIAAAVHKCTDPLKAGNWFLAHNSVKINGAAAITRSSILKCDKGGVLTPFFDEATAIAVAGSISTRNRWELGINVVASFGAGFFLPSAFSGWGAASVGGKIWLGGGRFVLGFLAFSGLNYGERGIIRTYHENAGDLKDNTTYDQMNNHKEVFVENGKPVEKDIDQNSYLGMPSKPDDFTQDSEDLVKVEKTGGSGSNSYKISYMSKITGVIESYTVLAESRALQKQLNQLDGLSRPVLSRNPIAQQLLNDLNAGKYPEWKNAIRFYNQNKMRPGMVDDGRTAMANATKENLKSFASNSVQGILFVIPFIGTWLSEEARADLALAVSTDLAANAGVSLVAETPVD
ncbi:hypothetical protein [Chryseobacterium sp. JK1]|uniref:hypothetical protein n=1 Tax=Chryseobacterium sp. JK1 TaxID=874294 RepID=UPI003D68E848